MSALIYKVPATLWIEITVFRDMMPPNLVIEYQCFGGTCSFHLNETFIGCECHRVQVQPHHKQNSKQYI